MALKPYLQLVRLPNLFTAAADSLAGWLLMGGALGDARQWPWLVGSSVATYAGGVVLNDVFDVEVDRRERPGRPVPSGKVGVRAAGIAGAVLLVGGVVAAWASGTRHGLGVSLALTACVVLYDVGLRRTALGPQVMGACRGLNLLLGMSQAARLGGPAAWGVAVAYGLFVTGITWISRSEAEPIAGVRRSVAAGVLLQNAAFVGYLAAAVHPELFPGGPPAAAGAKTTGSTTEGLLFLLLFALWVNHNTVQAIRAEDPAVVRRAVSVGILALVSLHIGLVVAVKDLPPGTIALVALWLAATFCGRWVYST